MTMAVREAESSPAIETNLIFSGGVEAGGGDSDGSSCDADRPTSIFCFLFRGDF